MLSQKKPFELMKQLQHILKEAYSIYMEKMKLYIKGKITYQNLEESILHLLPTDAIKIHNEVMIALFTETDIYIPDFYPDINEESLIRKDGVNYTRYPLFDYRFKNASYLNYVPEVKDASAHIKSFCPKGVYLPNGSTIHANMILAAWGTGIEAVSKKTIPMILSAVHMQIKNILTAILLRRKEFIYCDKRSLAASLLLKSNKFLRNNRSSRTRILARRSMLMSSSEDEISSSGMDSNSDEEYFERESEQESPPITLYELYEALKVFRKLIPLHSVYSVNMERIIVKLKHPTQEEMDSKHVYRQQEIINACLDDDDLFYTYNPNLHDC